MSLTLQQLRDGAVPAFLSPEQIVELGVFPGMGRAGIYQAIRTGELPAVRLGKRLLVPAEDLRRMAGMGGA